ncbi:MAG TPA: amino acid ABC transporter substrate-binding protein [Clostridiales bacterium]|nr:amino acid ABC transporter substrate-binding protein [Clostridiales bacterium]
MTRKITKLMAFAMVMLLAVLPITACSQDKGKKLVVGMELAYPPFETTDASNNPTGISVDFAKALGAALGREVIIENIAWAGLIPALETKKVDLIISSMTITEERKKQIDFSEPYAMANLALLINKDSPVQSYADLDQPGRILAVKKGSTGHIYAEAHLKNATIMVFDKESACVLEVVQGKADAFTYDQLTIYKNWKQYEDKTRVNLAPYQEAPEYWGVALRKGESELRDQINSFIKKYRDEGGFDKLAEKYLTDQKKIFDEMEIPFFFDVEASPST